MIKLKDLELRSYVDKKCTSFSYTLKDDKNEEAFTAKFTNTDHMSDQPKGWIMLIVLDRTRDADSQVYRFNYQMPKANLPLELIAATGLKFFQLYLKEEIQSKAAMDFLLGERLEGM